MAVKVIFFGHLGEKTGTHETHVDHAVDLLSLKCQLADRFPVLETYDFLVAVNQEIIQGNGPLNSGDEVAFMPPYAGG